MRGVVENIYARFQEGDLEALFDVLDGAVDWTVQAAHPELGLSGQYHGPAGVRQWFEMLGRGLHLAEFTPDAWVVDGDTVVVLGRERSKEVASGKTSLSRWAHVWTFRDGRVVAFEEIAAAIPAGGGI